MSTLITQLLLTLVPCAIVGLIAYYFFKSYIRDEEHRRGFLLQKEAQKELIPYKIQALERMTLYLERIAPGRLLLRVKPVGDDIQVYVNLLIDTIEKEFEHNLTQQIYLSQQCWEAVTASKNATITLIRKVSRSEEVQTAAGLREQVLKVLLKQPAPSYTGLEFVKQEARKMW